MEVKPTLSEFFDPTFIRVWIVDHSLDEKTHSSYQQSIAWWKKLTLDPPVDQITGKTIDDFMEALKLCPGKKRGSLMKASSRAKHATQLDTVLKTVGPQTRHNRFGQNVLSYEPPFFNAPKFSKKPPHQNWTIEEIRLLYSAADYMTRPLGADSPDFWRALVVVGYYTGLRIFALTHVLFTDLNERWLTSRDEISKGDRGIVKWLPQLAIDHIDRLRPLGHEEILHVPNFKTRRRLLYEDLHKLQRIAGIAELRRWGFQSFRKTYTTEIANPSKEHQDNLKMAQRACGHSSLSITLAHYANGTEEDLRLAEATDEMRRPVPPDPEPEVTVATVELPPKKLPPAVERWNRQEEFID